MFGAVFLLPSTPSWCGAQLKEKAQGQLYLILTLTSMPWCLVKYWMRLYGVVLR
jgi:hypothetical protein